MRDLSEASRRAMRRESFVTVPASIRAEKRTETGDAGCF